MHNEEGIIAVLVSVGVSIFFALISYELVCWEAQNCHKAGTCFTENNSCGFGNLVTASAWRLFNTTATFELEVSANEQGICSPGERQNLDPLSGRMECVRHRAYPDAVNYKMFDEGSDYRTRYCGKWIDAKASYLTEQTWAFYDEDRVAADVLKVVSARGSGRLSTTDVAKFRSACQRMVISNSEGPNAKSAYEYLAGVAVPALNSIDDALASIGKLGSHFCDAPVQIATTFNANGFFSNVSEGVEIAGEALFEALYAVGAHAQTCTEAKQFASEMKSATYASRATLEDAEKIARGSLSNTWLEPMVGNYNWVRKGCEMDAVSRFKTVAEGTGMHTTRSYLLGLAAYCGFATRSAVSGNLALDKHLRQEIDRVREEKPPAAALGRLKSLQTDRFGSVSGSHSLSANSVTWSRLRPKELFTLQSPKDAARTACMAASRAVFPDQSDEREFKILVTDEIYAKVQSAVSQIRVAVQAELSTPRDDDARALLIPDSKAKAIQKVGETEVKIAGAPRGTWAGVSTEFIRPEFTSSDSALVIMLKQGRAVFLDRMRLSVLQESVCHHPPLFDSLERNAYMLLNHPCVVLLPGILVPPFAGERYDDVSLYSRIGWVIAHEFAHATADKSGWDPEAAARMFKLYPESTWVEAAADLIGASAIMRLGVVNNATLCVHVSQLWCSRQPHHLTTSIHEMAHGELQRSHPSPAIRGNNVCAFLEENFS